jgi:homocitrate synthase
MNEEQTILKNFKGVIDSTLREGFQFSRANFSLRDQKGIFDRLSRIGVDYVEMGNPAKPEIREMIAATIGPRERRAVRVLCHIRNHASDVEAAIACGADGVNILCTADSERLAGMGLTRDSYLDRLEQNVRSAHSRGLEVRVGVEDFFGQPETLSREIHRLAESAGVERIAVADTLGRVMSWDVRDKIRELRNRISTDIEVHFHNDLGHAVGNALAAIQGGANWVSASLLGIGERTGITPLSSLLVNLYVLDPGIAERYDLSLLTEAEGFVARRCGIDMPPHLMTNPVNGFAHKAGIHLNALLKFGPQKYEPLPPGVIGNRRNLVIKTLLSGRTTEAEVEEFNRRFGG